MPVEDYNNDNSYGAPDNHDRINTATDIRPNLGAPDFRQPSPNENAFRRTEAPPISSGNPGEKPKVQIKPYKFTFD